tara:strand:+ start:198 stop:1685 length:1488 start_codon:yes stop_codon:yes gene_type:complete
VAFILQSIRYKVNSKIFAFMPKNSISNNSMDNTNPLASLILDLVKDYELAKYDVAESKALSITKEFPKHQLSWKVLAAVSLKKNNNQAALKANKEALKLNPKDDEVLNNLGLTLQKLGEFREAEINLKKAISLKPNFYQAYFNLGITLKALGKLEEAEKSYKAALKFQPNYAQAYYNLGNLLKETGRLEEAEASFKQAIALKPDYAEAYFNLGNTNKDFGRLEEAEASYRKAIELTNGFTEAYRKLAITLRELGRNEEATESDRYEKFLGTSNIKANKSIKLSENLPHTTPSPIEHPMLYRAGMGTENVGGFLRSMAQMLRPRNILEIGAGYTTPFLLEALINNERVYDDGNLDPSYFKNYIYEPKLVVIDNMSLGELSNKPGMNAIISSKYTDFLEGSFEDKANILRKKYEAFDFVWFDCGGAAEYKKFMKEYWDICSNYIFFHFTYSSGRPNELHDIILKNMTGNPYIFDIIEPHKSRQGSITMVRKNENFKS